MKFTTQWAVITDPGICGVIMPASGENVHLPTVTSSCDSPSLDGIACVLKMVFKLRLHFSVV
jgi:hypothetical protein